jgi:hypothetical protein
MARPVWTLLLSREVYPARLRANAIRYTIIATLSRSIGQVLTRVKLLDPNLTLGGKAHGCSRPRPYGITGHRRRLWGVFIAHRDRWHRSGDSCPVSAVAGTPLISSTDTRVWQIACFVIWPTTRSEHQEGTSVRYLRHLDDTGYHRRLCRVSIARRCRCDDLDSRCPESKQTQSGLRLRAVTLVSLFRENVTLIEKRKSHFRLSTDDSTMQAFQRERRDGSTPGWFVLPFCVCALLRRQVCLC